MELSLNNPELIKNYKSKSQIIRVLTENWFLKQMYCPCCLNDSLKSFPNNMKGFDFFCPQCGNKFQLKSSKKSFDKRVLDGEYNTMKKIILKNDSPNFFLLNYDFSNLQVKCLFLIPKFFISFSMLEKRKPLSSKAKRAGWTGCNFLLGRLPREGKIPIIQEEKILDKEKIVKTWKRMSFINSSNSEFRGWTSDVLKIIEDLPEKFSLIDIYKYENYFKKLHPLNNNIKPKIRQQLQILRDNNIIEFLGEGRYKFKESGFIFPSI